MAVEGEKITEMGSAGPLAGNELFEVVQGGDNKKVTLDAIADFIGSPPAFDGVDSVTGPAEIVDNSDPDNPVITHDSTKEDVDNKVTDFSSPDDTTYPTTQAVQTLFDSLPTPPAAGVESVSGPPGIVNNTDPLNPVITQDATKEDLSNKVTNLISPNNTTYPTTLAVANAIATVPMNFVGKFTSLAALETAYPTANLGNWAQVDIGSGYPAVEYIWDDEDGWVTSGSPGIGGIQSVTGPCVDNTDPLNPVVNPCGTGGVESVTGNDVDNTDPLNPVILEYREFWVFSAEGDGSQTVFPITGYTIKYLVGIMLDGIPQKPDTYSVDEDFVVTFDTAPGAGVQPVFVVFGLVGAFLGDLYFDNFTRASLGPDYTKTGTNATFTIISNQLQVSAGVNTITEYIKYNAYLTNLSSWRRSARVIVGPITSTSYGIGFGIQSARSTPINFSYMFVLRLDTGDVGKIDWHFENDPTPIQTLATTRDIIEGDQLTVTFIRDDLSLTAQIYNSRTGITYTDTFECNLDINGTPPPNAGYFAMYSIGGTQIVIDDGASTETPKNADYLLLGDSIGFAAGATARANGWFERTMTALGDTGVNNSGFGNLVENINAEEAKSLTPDKIIVSLGVNNQGLSETPTTIKGKIDALVDDFVTAGYALEDLYVCLLPPTSVGGSSTVVLNAMLIAEYGYGNTIDLFKCVQEKVLAITPVASSPYQANLALAYDSGDRVHPNDDGYEQISIVASEKLQPTRNVIASSSFYVEADTDLEDYVPEVGAAWASFNGSTHQVKATSECVASAKALTFGGDTIAIMIQNLGVANCEIRYKLIYATVMVYPAFRFTNYANYVNIYFNPAAPSIDDGIYETIAGVQALIPGQTFTPALLAPDTDCEFRIVLNGASVTIYQNGALIGSATMSNSTGQGAGVQSQGSTGYLKLMEASTAL